MSVLAALKRIIWYPSVPEITQGLHAALGLAGVWGPVAVLGVSPWWGFVGVLAFAAVKEGVFDIIVESDGWYNGLIDFSFYALGAGAALGLTLAARLF